MWPFKKKEFIMSNKKYSEYLPVGSIVKLLGDSQEYMIYRYMGNACVALKSSDNILSKSSIYSFDKNNVRYHVDYAICPYPSGDLNNTYYIMHEDIVDIIYLGYDDEYRKNVLEDITRWNEE